jgi:signal transduction histidine kinase
MGWGDHRRSRWEGGSSRVSSRRLRRNAEWLAARARGLKELTGLPKWRGIVSTSEAAKRSKRNIMWVAVAAVLVVCGLLGSTLVAISVGHSDEQRSRRSVEASATAIASTLQLAIQREEDLVVSAGGFWVGNPQASQGQFIQWANGVQALQRYPELTGFGYGVVVPAANLADFAAQAVRDPMGPLSPDGTFQVAPHGNRPFYCLLRVSLERDKSNLVPAGTDYCAIPAVGSAILRARDSGQGSYEPFQFGGQTLLVIDVPAYRDGVTPATQQARRSAFMGWIGMAVAPDVLLDTAVSGHPGTAVSMRYRAGASDVVFSRGKAPGHPYSVQLDLKNGWTITTSSAILGGGVLSNGNALALLIIGVALSLLLSSLVLVLATSRSRALRLVQERTAQLRGAQAKLVDTARQAGMAEIATNVLHNVGNVLNSINISASLALQEVRTSKSASLVKVVALMRQHAEDLGEFLTTDARGKTLPSYLDKLATALASERESIDQELQRLCKGVDHVKEIVAAQQSLAGVSGVIEPVRVSELIDDALRMAGILDGDHITIFRDIPEDPVMSLDKHRVLLILLNLISNATHAMKANGSRPRQLSMRSQLSPGHEVNITVSDNGEGVPSQNLTRIFEHGFTTHADGHGFGLHSSAIAAREMGGTLTLDTSDASAGAAFTLQVPLEREPVSV